VTHGGSEIGRADEDTVNAIDRGDGIEIFIAVTGFRLGRLTQISALALVEIVGDGVPARGAGECAADTANAGFGITSGGDDGGRLCGGFDHGHEQGLDADIEQLLDEIGVADGRTHDGMGRIGRDGL
jgi:hypothetical protein